MSNTQQYFTTSINTQQYEMQSPDSIDSGCQDLGQVVNQLFPEFNSPVKSTQVSYNSTQHQQTTQPIINTNQQPGQTLQIPAAPQIHGNYQGNQEVTFEYYPQSHEIQSHEIQSNEFHQNRSRNSTQAVEIRHNKKERYAVAKPSYGTSGVSKQRPIGQPKQDLNHRATVFLRNQQISPRQVLQHDNRRQDDNQNVFADPQQPLQPHYKTFAEQNPGMGKTKWISPPWSGTKRNNAQTEQVISVTPDGNIVNGGSLPVFKIGSEVNYVQHPAPIPQSQTTPSVKHQPWPIPQHIQRFNNRIPNQSSKNNRTPASYPTVAVIPPPGITQQDGQQLHPSDQSCNHADGQIDNISNDSNTEYVNDDMADAVKHGEAKTVFKPDADRCLREEFAVITGNEDDGPDRNDHQLDQIITLLGQMEAENEKLLSG